MLGNLERITLPAGRSFRVLRWLDNLGKVESLLDASRTEHITGQGQHWHYHIEMELTAFTAGEGTFFVGDHIGPFCAGEVVLLGENLPHYWHTTRSCSGFSVQWNFPPEHALWSFPESAPLTALFKAAGRGIRYTGNTAVSATALLREISQANGLDRLSGLLRLFSLLAGAPRAEQGALSLASFSLPHDSKHQHAISEAVRYLLANYRNQIRLDEILRLTRMRKATFSRQFKRHSGKTFSAFVSDLRLQSARRELVETDRSVLEIAVSCGFSEVSYFNRIFRRHLHCTPSEFRARERRLKKQTISKRLRATSHIPKENGHTRRAPANGWSQALISTPAPNSPIHQSINPSIH
jgi:AraC-like DNA-binding protein